MEVMVEGEHLIFRGGGSGIGARADGAHLVISDARRLRARAEGAHLILRDDISRGRVTERKTSSLRVRYDAYEVDGGLAMPWAMGDCVVTLTKGGATIIDHATVTLYSSTSVALSEHLADGVYSLQIDWPRYNDTLYGWHAAATTSQLVSVSGRTTVVIPLPNGFHADWRWGTARDTSTISNTLWAAAYTSPTTLQPPNLDPSGWSSLGTITLSPTAPTGDYACAPGELPADRGFFAVQLPEGLRSGPVYLALTWSYSGPRWDYVYLGGAHTSGHFSGWRSLSLLTVRNWPIDVPGY
jgi:hypothetical protein